MACTNKLTTVQCGASRLHELCQWKSEGAQPLHLQIWGGGGLSIPCPPISLPLSMILLIKLSSTDIISVATSITDGMSSPGISTSQGDLRYTNMS